MTKFIDLTYDLVCCTSYSGQRKNSRWSLINSRPLSGRLRVDLYRLSQGYDGSLELPKWSHRGVDGLHDFVLHGKEIEFSTQIRNTSF